MQQKIVLVTSGQPTANPRLAKEATALSEAGYDVSVVYNFWVRWSDKHDEAFFKANPGIRFYRVGGHPDQQPLLYYYTRVKHKLYKIIQSRIFPNSYFWKERIKTRCFDELFNKAKSLDADLYIGHNMGALPVVVKLHTKFRKKFGFDMEDYYPGEHPEPAVSARYLEMLQMALPMAEYITAASPMILEKTVSNVPGLTSHRALINNVFPIRYQLPFNPLPIEPGGKLKLYWFSQNLGIDRGVQDAINAMNLIDEFPVELLLIGNPPKEGFEYFSKLLTNKKHSIIFGGTCSEAELFIAGAQCHIGLALETGIIPNSNILWSNKVFSYLISGNAIIASDTVAQQLFLKTYPSVGKIYPIRDAAALAALLREYYNNPDTLLATRKAAYELAKQELNWEKEKQKFLALIQEVI